MFRSALVTRHHRIGLTNRTHAALTATAVVGRRSRRARAPKDASAADDDDGALVQQLVSATGLPRTTACKLVAARPAVPGFPSDPTNLQQRVQQLQALLGPEHAATALQRFPQIACCQPQALANNLSGWLDFFTPDSSSSSSAAAGSRELLLHRLASRPQLLAVNVETLAANLYETGAICQAEDLHAFAMKNMRLALTQPSVLQGKMITVLQLLNSSPLPPSQQQQQQHQPQKQSGAIQSLATGPTSVALQQQKLQQPKPPQRPPPQHFTYQQLQQAARRDHRWLLLSSERLSDRLLGLQRQLNVPLATVGQMFLKQPSLVTKSTELVAARAAALQQLPGLGPDRALGALVAFPALLNLRQGVVQERWRLLQEAAATSARWQQQLETVGPASIAAMLIRSQQHYTRLQVVAGLGAQGSCALQTVLNMPEGRYRQRLQALGAPPELVEPPLPS